MRRPSNTVRYYVNFIFLLHKLWHCDDMTYWKYFGTVAANTSWTWWMFTKRKGFKYGSRNCCWVFYGIMEFHAFRSTEEKFVENKMAAVWFLQTYTQRKTLMIWLCSHNIGINLLILLIQVNILYRMIGKQLQTAVFLSNKIVRRCLSFYDFCSRYNHGECFMGTGL